jgi:23S rRNA (pseudouridine1915-N3)-methyltransferase
MQITLAHIAVRAGSSAGTKDGFDAGVRSYLDRCSSFAATQSEAFRTVDALFAWAAGRKGRTDAVLVLLDSRGRSMTSEAFAAWVGARRDEGAQNIVFAIGPPDGWSDDARKRASLLLSLGAMTMAHSLARLVLAEQIYRATTILTGHPYHGGH